MKPCELIERCPFFNRQDISIPQKLVEKLKNQYCFDNHLACARYCVCQKLGPDFVPLDMLPHQQDWANQILHEAKLP